MFKIIMMICMILLAVGWLAYALWKIKENYDEKHNPKPKQSTKHLKKVRDSFEEYTQKLEQFERKNYDQKP